jgi:hypothetical protein
MKYCPFVFYGPQYCDKFWKALVEPYYKCHPETWKDPIFKEKKGHSSATINVKYTIIALNLYWLVHSIVFKFEKINQIFSNFHTLLCAIKYRSSLITVYFTFIVHEILPFFSKKIGTFVVSGWHLNYSSTKVKVEYHLFELNLY